MQLNYEAIADQALEDTDGQNNFARLNLSMADIISCIRPYTLSVLTYTLFVKCLAKVPKYVDLPNNNENDPIIGEADRGRWSFIISASDIINETMYKGDESNVNKSIKILMSRHMFFKFEVPVGKNYVYICTYNRYPALIGLFWPEHEKNPNSNNFKPIVTPKIIASLASDKSYKNALSRLCKPLHNKMRTCDGWNTVIEVENRVKEAFCTSFLGGLIDGTCPAVKSHFKGFHESGLDFDKYVAYVWKTAKSLNPYQGIEINEKFLSNLRLPKSIMDKISKEISYKKKLPETSATEKKMIKKLENKDVLTQVESTSDNQKITQVEFTSDSYSTQVEFTSDNYSTQVESTSDNSILEGDKSLNDNDLQENKDSYQRIIHTRKNNIKKKEEIDTINFSLFHESNKIENDSSVGISEDNNLEPTEKTLYNVDMNKNEQQDMALSAEKCDQLAFSDLSLIPHANRAKILKRQSEKIIDPEIEERNVMKKLASGHISDQKKLDKRENATILNNAEKFVTVFRRIVKETLPNVFYATSSSEQTKLDCYASQAALDKLRERGAFDEEVLLAWMNFTVNACKKRKNFKGVSEMLHSLPLFEKHIPSPESIAKRQSHKPIVAPQKKNVIETSMINLFPDSFPPNRIILSCQFWGMPMTAQYIASKTNEDESKKLIIEALKKSSVSDLKGIMGMSAKYDSETSTMVFSDWKTVMAKVLLKLGKPDSFQMSDIDLANVKEFAEKFNTQY